MGDVAAVVGGGTPRSDQAEYFSGDIPWITPADLSGYTLKFISAGARSITQVGLDNSGAKVLPAGAVLFSSRAPIGYVAIAANPVSTNQGFKSFVLRDRLTSDFVYYYLQHAKKLAVEMASGTTFLEISGKKAAQIPIPIAPLPEQRRIVAEIEKQFTRLEAGVAALRRVQANLKRYCAAVLKAACEGRLVPTEAELQKSEVKGQKTKARFETGEALLARILTERRKNWLARRSLGEGGQGRGQYKVPAAPDTADLPRLPEGWTWSSLDQLLSLLRNGISAKPDAEYGLPILRISAVRALSVNLAEARYLNAKASDYPDYALTEGDLLFTRYNGNPDLVGVCGVVPPLTSPLVHPDKLIRCKLVSSGALPDFVAVMANVGASRDYLAKRVRTTAGQAGISGGDLKGLPIPLAPLAEQTRIVAEVERRLSVVEELEAVVNANLQRATQLRQSILQKAFTGELV
jgi:type I restriction enzyme S subunit